MRRSAKRSLPPQMVRWLLHEEYWLGYRALRLRAAWRIVRARPRVLFYPELPRPQTVVYRVCAALGYSITNDPRKPADLVLKWEPATRSAAFAPLDDLARNQRVVNRLCNDISKERVNDAFAEAFGYPLAVDPLTHDGPCVEKSDDNALHDGRIVSCPIPERRIGYVYQRLVDNRTGDSHVVDLRLPVIGSTLPFVYLRSRPVDRRFRSGNESVEMAHVYGIFDREEVLAILRFCQLLQLEYGELDILRDRADGRLYVVDANNTPYGPPSGIGARDSERAVQLLAAAFAAEFQAPCWAMARA